MLIESTYAPTLALQHWLRIDLLSQRIRAFAGLQQGQRIDNLRFGGTKFVHRTRKGLPPLGFDVGVQTVRIEQRAVEEPVGPQRKARAR